MYSCLCTLLSYERKSSLPRKSMGGATRPRPDCAIKGLPPSQRQPAVWVPRQDLKMLLLLHLFFSVLHHTRFEKLMRSGAGRPPPAGTPATRHCNPPLLGCGLRASVENRPICETLFALFKFSPAPLFKFAPTSGKHVYGQTASATERVLQCVRGGHT
jgi:hypothetical protein